MDVYELVEKLKLYDPKKIILFGSRAYGNPSEDSDIDIAIIKNTTKSFHERLIDLRRLVRTTTPIDFFVFTEKEIAAKKDTNPFLEEILRKGRVVYEQ